MHCNICDLKCHFPEVCTEKFCFFVVFVVGVGSGAEFGRAEGV